MKHDNSSTMKADKYLGLQGTKIKMPSHVLNSGGFSDEFKELSSLNQLQNRSLDNKSRRLQSGLMEISDLCAALKLSDTIKSIASEKWSKFEKARKKHSRGGDKFMYAALIYMAELS